VTSTHTAADTATPTPTATLAAGCPATPAVCEGAERHSLRLKSPSAPARHKLLWRWKKGLATLTQSSFGNPVSGGTSYKLCLYDQTAGAPVFKMGLTIPAAGTCGTQPCWKAIGQKGWKYISTDGTAGGIGKLLLVGGDAGSPRVLLKGKGANIPLPVPLSGTTFFDQDTQVIIQLHSSDPVRCWSSSFDGSQTVKNNGEQFVASAP
jgi:hypothetical protein